MPFLPQKFKHPSVSQDAHHAGEKGECIMGGIRAARKPAVKARAYLSQQQQMKISPVLRYIMAFRNMPLRLLSLFSSFVILNDDITYTCQASNLSDSPPIGWSPAKVEKAFDFRSPRVFKP
jgi:hypothetical protein